MKVALKAVASVANINIGQATQITRRQPLFDEEIHIEEELINLEEAIDSYHLAAPTLKEYPDMRRQALRERRAILTHCVGLIARMLHKQPLPREYTPADTQFAIQKLVRLLVKDARKVGYQLNNKQLEAMRPYMNWQQQFNYREWTLNPLDYLSSLLRKLVSAR